MVKRRNPRATRLFAASAFALAIAGSVGFLLLPVYTSTGNGPTTHDTLVEVNGSDTLILLAIPVVLTAVPLLAPQHRRAIGACAFLLTAFAILGSWTIGLAYLPSALLLGVAWAAARGRPGSPASDFAGDPGR
jgi:hypothetical protein